MSHRQEGGLVVIDVEIKNLYITLFLPIFISCITLLIAGYFSSIYDLL